MTITKKINDFLKSYAESDYSNTELLHAIINEMKEYHAHKFDVCYKDNTIYLTIITYLLENDSYLMRDEFLDDFADIEKLNPFFLYYLNKKGLLKQDMIDFFDLSKDDIKRIKEKDYRLNLIRKERREQEFKELWNKNKKTKVIMNWSVPKRVEELQKQLQNANGYLEKRKIMGTLEDLTIALQDVNEKVILKALMEKGVDVDDYSHIEFTDFGSYQPVIHLYKTEKDYKVGRYSFKDSYRLNYRVADFPKFASTLYYNLTRIADIKLVKIKGIHGLFKYKFEVTSWAGEKFVVPLPTIPKQKMFEFFRTSLKLQESDAFNAIKDYLMRDCFLYTEYSFINNKQIGPSFIIDSQEMNFLLMTDSFKPTEFYKAQKHTKFASFNTDLKIKSIVSNPETEEFIVTCNLGSDLLKHIKKQDFVYKELITNELFKIENNKLIISGQSLGLFFPKEWFELANEKDNQLSYIVDNCFLNISIFESDDKKHTGSCFTFTTKYC